MFCMEFGSLLNCWSFLMRKWKNMWKCRKLMRIENKCHASLSSRFLNCVCVYLYCMCTIRKRIRSIYNVIGRRTCNCVRLVVVVMYLDVVVWIYLFCSSYSTSTHELRKIYWQNTRSPHFFLFRSTTFHNTKFSSYERFSPYKTLKARTTRLCLC